MWCARSSGPSWSRRQLRCEFTAERLVLDCNAGPRPVTFTDATATVTWPADVEVRLLLPGEEPASDTGGRI